MTVLGRSKYPLDCQTCDCLVNGVCQDILFDKLCEPHLEGKEPSK
jgi:hypothetical protein